MSNGQALQATKASKLQDDAVHLQPLQCGMPFSFTMLRPSEPVRGYALQGDVIVEQNGIFSISSMVETSYIKLDSSFKQLVDSVLL